MGLIETAFIYTALFLGGYKMGELLKAAYRWAKARRK